MKLIRITFFTYCEDLDLSLFSNTPWLNAFFKPFLVIGVVSSLLFLPLAILDFSNLADITEWRDFCLFYEAQVDFKIELPLEFTGKLIVVVYGASTCVVDLLILSDLFYLILCYLFGLFLPSYVEISKPSPLDRLSTLFLLPLSELMLVLVFGLSGLLNCRGLSMVVA